VEHRDPFERAHGVSHPNDLGRNAEATLGGPLIADRLWFFGAGRWENTSIAQTLPVTGFANVETTGIAVRR